MTIMIGITVINHTTRHYGTAQCNHVINTIRQKKPQRNAVQHDSTQYDDVGCTTTRHNTRQNTTQYTTQHHTTQHDTIQNTTRHNTIQWMKWITWQTYRHTRVHATDIQTYRHTGMRAYRHTIIQTYRHACMQTAAEIKCTYIHALHYITSHCMASDFQFV